MVNFERKQNTFMDWESRKNIYFDSLSVLCLAQVIKKNWKKNILIKVNL